jgi:hypothetical protein
MQQVIFEKIFWIIIMTNKMTKAANVPQFGGRRPSLLNTSETTCKLGTISEALVIGVR